MQLAEGLFKFSHSFRVGSVGGVKGKAAPEDSISTEDETVPLSYSRPLELRLKPHIHVHPKAVRRTKAQTGR